MLHSITGILTEKCADKVYLNTHGLEWELLVSFQTLDALPVPGTEVRIYTHLIHKEDQMRLIGFAAIAERNVFFELLKVDGVGPKLALKILSKSDPQQLITYIEEENIAALTGIPGLGEKTASKLVFSLKGKMKAAGGTSISGAQDDIVRALTEMGYDRKKVLKAVEEVQKDPTLAAVHPMEKEKEIFKRCIVQLSS